MTWDGISRLYYNQIDMDYNSGGINPHMTCPSCGQPYQPHFKPVPTLPPTYDVNAKVTFTCPNCAAKLLLFVAVHKDTSRFDVCIQKSEEEGAGGIHVNWWL